MDSSNNPSKNELESNKGEKNKNNTDKAYELLIIGGEDHKTGDENDMEDRHTFLEGWAKQRFPN